MSRQLPRLTSDEDAELFVDTAGLSTYDLSAMKPHSFEFAKKSKQVNMRMPEQLRDAVKAHAAEQGMSYQRFIRQALATAIQPKR